jgi:hypothetical protein
MVRVVSLFSRIPSLLQRSSFATHVHGLKTGRHARGFSSRDQFVAMRFRQREYPQRRNHPLAASGSFRNVNMPDNEWVTSVTLDSTIWLSGLGRVPT